MKTTLSLLLLVAAASAQRFSLDQLLPDLPQKSNAIDGGDNTEGVNAAAHQTSFGASSFSSQPVPAAIAPNEPQQPAFVRGGEVAISGTLLTTGQEKATEVPGVIKQENNSKPFIESFAKQFSNNKQPAYGAAIDTQMGGNQAPSFGVLSGEQLGGNQQQTAFGVSSSSRLGVNQQTGFGAPSEDQFGGNQEPAFGASPSSQFGGNQHTGFGAPSEDQLGGNQEPAFGASSSSQFGDSQQSGIGVESGDQLGGSQTSFNPQSGGRQQGGLGASKKTQFGGNQQTGSGAAPDTQFEADQQTGVSSNFAGGPQNAATGFSGTYKVAFGDEYYIRTAIPFAGYRPTKYTSLDLSLVDFQNALRSSGHEEYISVPDDDGSDEAELYRLVGVAPASALQGGAALTYSANIGPTVGVYREFDDSYGPNPLASMFSALPGSQQPVRVRAEATLTGGSFAVLLDD